jgi:carboxymethylenebutenolidase
VIQQEIDSLCPPATSRAVPSCAGPRWAAALPPPCCRCGADVIKTDTTGLVAGEVTIPVGDFKMPAYRAGAGRQGQRCRWCW